ncbi:autophagy protein 16 [Colletotrichum scovillei]|uniref:Autophagy protein 16 n=1 Tax=Colletotrichum scovillei TaxID=1209932 RepID=A0A9P7UJS0_9PEZI|nr:autophagy protein 16 [Colletotrichum scovillei]KAF4774959.1 autophagy protein 16 [Colletotrichum scovillei]KAG7052070.1 autophagy protein 16 [Colletotrichum scovillei]KAG7071103.1 autophagy protein 16 [Colletotrichum scovillei]KAG7079378.1 autophagy protein 16 [Colletotrichum scovillei]
MADWRSEYLASIREQEKNNPVNLEIVQLCSQLSDHVAALEAENQVLKSKTAPEKKSKLTTSEKSNNIPPSPTTGTARTSSPDPTIAQLQLQLAEALRSNGTLKDRAKQAEDEAQTLRTKHKDDAKKVRSLTAENAALTTKLRDREHELREKRKLVENVQDDMITINLQMSMAEQERDRVKKENKELVDRWMKRMAQEADAMNLANER